jgi:hypothetical protein
MADEIIMKRAGDARFRVGDVNRAGMKPEARPCDTSVKFCNFIPTAFFSAGRALARFLSEKSYASRQEYSGTRGIP